MAKISYSLGRTINTGNYNSVRVDVSHEIECDETDVEKKYEQLRDFVRGKLREEVAHLT